MHPASPLTVFLRFFFSLSLFFFLLVLQVHDWTQMRVAGGEGGGLYQQYQLSRSSAKIPPAFLTTLE